MCIRLHQENKGVCVCVCVCVRGGGEGGDIC